MYELYIQNSDGVFKLADLGSEKPAINIQRNDIGELKDRQTDYSQAVKLPKSPNNCRLFSFINEFSVESDLRHRRMNCRLYCDGFTILGSGGLLKFVQITTNYFEVQLMGGTIDLFTRLKENNSQRNQKTLNDLNLTDPINQGYSGFLSSSNASNLSCFFGVADFSTEPSAAYSYDKSNKAITIECQYPFIWLKNIINQILYENGEYTIDTNNCDILEDDEYAKACISFVNADSMIYVDDTAICNVPYLKRGGGAYGNFIHITESSSKGITAILSSSNFYYGVSAIDIQDLYYKVLYNGQYTIEINIEVENIQNASNLILAAGLLSYGSEAYQTGTSITLNYKNTVWLYRNDSSFFSIYLYPPDVNTTYTCTITKLNVRIYGIGYVDSNQKKLNIDYNHLYCKPKGNLPDITQESFFKSFLQMYGLTVDVDIENKKVIAYTLNKVVKNKSNAKDWSDKYNKGTGNIKYTIGNYAKYNTIKYKEDSNDIDKSEVYTQISEGLAEYLFNEGYIVYYAETLNGTIMKMDSFLTEKAEYWVIGSSITVNNGDINFKDIGTLTVKDDNLDETLDLIEFPYKATEQSTTTDIDGNFFNISKIKRLTTSSTSDGFPDSQDPNILLYNGNVHVHVKNESGDTLGDCYLPSLSPVSSSTSLRASALVSKYYAALQNNILSDVRVIEDAEFYLTPLDIQEYDPFTPVYIDAFGAYFYVNKIKNYVSGKLTKVDLVKI